MMNLGDSELELIDPTPDVHCLFLHFDNLFFWRKLASRAAVRWSKRMYSCAGVCTYDRGGLCDIALSEPLLKLRPRKDMIETLLHEMIHAFLFVTRQDQDRDGHGPNFKAHMHRINKAAGLNISIYHSFHDEVELYQNHWWRCDGPCQYRRPHFGIVRRTCNRAPGPSDYWWCCHQRNCGGTFIKIKEPEPKGKKAKEPVKPKADIRKFINNPKTIDPKTVPAKPVLKDSSNIPVRTKSNGGNTVIITKKDPVFNPKAVPQPQPVLFNGSGHIINADRKRSNSVDVNDTVRSVWASKNVTSNPDHVSNVTNTVRRIWANKQLPATPNTAPNNIINNNNNKPNLKKHKSETVVNSPPTKIKKIDDYFNTSVINVLKDLYGDDLRVEKSNKDDKLVAIVRQSNPTRRMSVPSGSVAKPKTECLNMVACPICNVKVVDKDINRHLDECLNKDIIETLKQENPSNPPIRQDKDVKELKGVDKVPNLPRNPQENPSNSSIRHDKDAKKIKGIDRVPNPSPNMQDLIALNMKKEEDIISGLIRDATRAIAESAKMMNEQEINEQIRKEQHWEQFNTATNFVDLTLLDDESFHNEKTDELNKVKVETVNQHTNSNNTAGEKQVNTSKSNDVLSVFDSNDVNTVKSIVMRINYDKHIQKADNFILPKERSGDPDFGDLPSFLDEVASKIKNPTIKTEPGTSKDVDGQICACCGKKVDKPIQEHLDECLMFITDNTEPQPSTSFANETIVIDDDNDICDESMTMNATGTKTPCPCCLEMVEELEMNDHLDRCLS